MDRALHSDSKAAIGHTKEENRSLFHYTTNVCIIGEHQLGAFVFTQQPQLMVRSFEL